MCFQFQTFQSTSYYYRCWRQWAEMGSVSHLNKEQRLAPLIPLTNDFLSQLDFLLQYYCCCKTIAAAILFPMIFAISYFLCYCCHMLLRRELLHIPYGWGSIAVNATYCCKESCYIFPMHEGLLLLLPHTAAKRVALALPSIYLLH